MKRFKIGLATVALFSSVAISAFSIHRSPKAVGDYYGVTGMVGSAYVFTSVLNTCNLRDPLQHCLSTSSTVCIVKQVSASPVNPNGYFLIIFGGFYVS
jgi:hypothetical protein